MTGRGRRRGWEAGSNRERYRGSVLYLSGYWVTAKSSSCPGELAGIHCVQINHDTACVSASHVVFDFILIMYSLHTRTHTHLAEAMNGHLVAKNTTECLLKHKKLVF